MSKANSYFETDIWQPIPIVSKEQRAKGHAGGEGCQWPVCITRDQEDGQLAFFTTDVSGIYKSTDGGRNWSPSFTGFHSGSANGVQIDPNNKNHLIAYGSAKGFYLNGIHVSWDCGETWKATLYACSAGVHDQRIHTAFDATTYDEKIDGSAVAYWSREKNTTEGGKREGHDHPALYKSVDGGNSWSEIPDSAQYGGCNIRVHQNNGWLFVASPDGGLWRSKDKGESFEKLLEHKILWIENVFTRPDIFYFTTKEGMYITYDCGDSFTFLKGENYPTMYPRFLTVSPADENCMIIQDDPMLKEEYQPTVWGKNISYYSTDGGKVWQPSHFDTSELFAPFNARQRMAAWAPDGSDILTFGGDCVMISTDNGKTFRMASDGYNGICAGANIGYNINKPENILLPCQDYNGAFSTDGGYSWTYLNWSEQFWGGHTYGGYCWNEKEMCAGLAKSWSGQTVGGEVEICITRDGGKTVEHTGCICTGVKKCMAVIGDDDTVFFGEWKTTDRGHTWKRMVDQSGEPVIEGVMAYDFSSDRLFAIKEGQILQSYDNGETWEFIFRFTPRPEGLSYDHVHEKLYVAVDQLLFTLAMDGTVTRIKTGYEHVRDVYVNPDNVDMIYMTGHDWLDYGSESVWRSLDGGKTWVSMIRTPENGMKGPGILGQPRSLYIDRSTKYVMLDFACRGLWKMKLPEI